MNRRSQNRGIRKNACPPARDGRKKYTFIKKNGENSKCFTMKQIRAYNRRVVLHTPTSSVVPPLPFIPSGRQELNKDILAVDPNLLRPAFPREEIMLDIEGVNPQYLNPVPRYSDIKKGKYGGNRKLLSAIRKNRK